LVSDDIEVAVEINHVRRTASRPNLNAHDIGGGENYQ
jgi:hypothetical protein